MYSYKEFLEKKAKEATIADYNGPLATKPPQDGKYEKTPAKAGEKTPYKADGEQKGLMTADTDEKTGFGDMPAPNMAPKDAMPHGEKPKHAVKHIKQGSKLKEFFDKTSGLTPGEFLAYMRENVVHVPDAAVLHGMDGAEFTPHPHEVIDYTVSMMGNPRLVSRLVSETARKGKLADFVAELLNHPEFCKEVAVQTNEAVAQALVDDEKTDGAGVLPQPEEPEDVAKLKAKNMKKK